MGPQVYWVERGVLAIVSRPSSEWLDDDIAQLRRLGFGLVVCLLESREIRELGLQAESSACAESELVFHHVPVADRGIPQDTSGFVALARDAANSTAAVAVHCRAGIGRSGMLAAAVLIARGRAVDEAVSAVSSARGCQTPDTAEQLQWLHDNRDRLRHPS